MIRWMILITAMVATVTHPKPERFFEGFAVLGLWALLEIAEEIAKLRKAHVKAQTLLVAQMVAESRKANR